MKNLYLTLLIIAFSFVMSGCLFWGAPSCSSDEVKKRVELDADPQIKDQLIKQNYSLIMLDILYNYDNFSSEEKKQISVVMTEEKIKYDYVKYFQLKLNAKGIEHILELVDEMSSNISLKNIRTNEKNNEIRKSVCSAEFGEYNEYKVDYNAQYNDDGKLIVEIIGFHGLRLF